MSAFIVIFQAYEPFFYIGLGAVTVATVYEFFFMKDENIA